MVYYCFITWGIDALEWFHCGSGLPFVARAAGWDVKGNPCCPCGSSLGMGSRRAQEGSLYGELLRSSVHHQGGWFVGECIPVYFQDGAPSVDYGVIPQAGDIIFFLRCWQWAMLVEASTALRYLRAWIRLCGRGKRMEALAQINSLSSRK